MCLCTYNTQSTSGKNSVVMRYFKHFSVSLKSQNISFSSSKVERNYFYLAIIFRGFF